MIRLECETTIISTSGRSQGTSALEYLIGCVLFPETFRKEQAAIRYVAGSANGGAAAGQVPGRRTGCAQSCPAARGPAGAPLSEPFQASCAPQGAFESHLL